ncbi:hypothetical protein [Dethiosulfatarculus sandiegensis]|nr:hypothetical protein [Dethiosulfatarculus sandiegensis]
MPGFTKRLLNNLAPTGKEYVKWDTESSGLSGRIRPTDRKVFFRECRTLEVRQIKLFTWSYCRLPINLGHKEARSYLAKRDKGEDVTTTRSKARKAPTTKKLAERHFKKHVIPPKKPFSVSRDYRSRERLIVPVFASYKIKVFAQFRGVSPKSFRRIA